MLLLLSFVITLSVGCEQLKSKKNMAQLNSIAETIEQTGPSPAVVTQLKNYLTNFPEDELAWTILGNCHIDLDEVPAATNAFETALRLNPSLVQAITGQGILLRQQGRYEEAMAMYQKALDIDPNYAQAYASMVALAIFQKDYAKAAQYGEQSYRLDNTDPVIAANLTLAYHYLGDVENREKFKKTAARLNYRNMDTLQQIIDGKMVIGE